ncbi:MAG: cyclic nucleotide-binding domain-containing protein [Pseudomonadota bacterium]
MRKVLFILGQLSDDDAAWLARNGRIQLVAAGQTLIRQGTQLDTIFIVLEGAMSVMVGPGVKLAEVGSGDILGEMSLVDAGPTAASVVVDRDARVLAIPKPVILRKLAEDTAFAARFYRALAMFLSDRMRGTIRHLGYGTEDNNPGEGRLADELDPNVLDHVHLAGARFERMLKHLAGG